jgi:hypothetical protein
MIGIFRNAAYQRYEQKDFSTKKIPGKGRPGCFGKMEGQAP